MATVDTLNIEITTNANQAADSIRNLTKALNNLNKNLNDEKLANVSTQFKKLSDSLGALSSTNIGKFNKLVNAMERYTKVAKEVKQVSDIKLPSVDTPETTMTPTASVAPPTASGDTEKVVTNNHAVEKSAKKAADGLKKLTNTLKDSKKSFEPFSKGLSKITTVLSKFVKALGRIAFYRAIRMLFKGISDGIKEGVNNLALYSKALNDADSTHANNTMSRFATEMLYLKNAIGAVVMPILNALIPAFEKLGDITVTVINQINQAFAVIAGRTTYTRAKKFWVDYAESLDKSSGKAKELNKQLAKFDELNNLTTNDSSGSGNDDTANALQMFEEANVQMNPLLSFIDKVKNVLYPHIERIYETLKKTWTEIQPSLERIKENLQKIWDNVLEPIILKFTDGFGEGFADRFDGIGDAIVKITDKVADLTDKWADWSEKVKDQGIVDKLSNIAYYVGLVTQGVMFGGLLTGPGLSSSSNIFDFIIDRVKRTLLVFVWYKIGQAKIFNFLKEKTIELGDKISENFTLVKETVEKVKEKWDLLTDSTKTLKEKWEEFISSTDSGKSILEWIYDMAQKLIEKFKELGEVIASSGLGALLGATSFSAPSSSYSASAGKTTSSFASNVSNVVSNVSNWVAGTTNVNVTLEGDSKNLFKVVKKESDSYTKKTGHSAFGY